ncbi:Mobile element protein [Candidatus Enterovibrio altilux]|uniref:Mobile element protein n=1 Tax=Candidatus Enterovibrio altilux TaxID=1927128 RepID=A0A291B9N9_9GAMM|nr:Mobile element protein [Candidatus Enterovibrio luxaltus]
MLNKPFSNGIKLNEVIMEGSHLFSDLAIMMALMVKRVLSMLLSCSYYSCISKRAKTVNVAFKTED